MPMSEWAVWLTVFFGFLQTAILIIIAYRLRDISETDTEDTESFIA